MGWGAARFIAGVLALALSAACTSGSDSAGDDPPPPAGSLSSTTASTSSGPGRSTTSSSSGQPSAGPTRTSEPPPGPVRFDQRAAMHTIRFLAVEIGPREATSANYRRAARWVESRFEAYGYDVRRQRLRVPAGNSWGIDVPAGPTWNVVATPPGFRAAEPHLVVGAHLDTVPQAPGAEDDASGISVTLELARMAMRASARLPVMFVAFAAEEPRGEGDRLHHFGSIAMVDRLDWAERRAVDAMVALDRVGVGTVVPICFGGLGSPAVRGSLLRAAERVGVPASSCLNTAADHWSFEKAGMRAARVGGTPYAGYHSPGDLPSVINRSQLVRVGRVMWEWLRLRPT
jgi:hypothetical protein